MNDIVQLFTDGGVVLKNPSKHGGTWAWIGIDNAGQMVAAEQGVVTPEQIGMSTVSNNVTELLAALHALEFVGKGWEGELFTDSVVTLRRITGGLKFNGVPNSIRVRVLEIRRERKYSVSLVGGHPSNKDLASGFLKRNNLPTSVWNVHCDKECQRLAKEFISMQRS